MDISTAMYHQITEVVREVAKEHILPRYRALAAGEVDSKDYASDLVTIADTEAEAAITERLSCIIPEAFIIGEEAVAADPSLLDSLPEKELVIIIDPIDGTWNFAKGNNNFGVIVSVIKKGETVFGLLYDPLSDTWDMAVKDGGAWSQGDDGKLKPLTASPAKPLSEMIGFIPYYIFGYTHGQEARDRLLKLFPEFDRIMSLRCSAHEYRMLSEGSVDFSLTSNTKPWDHAAGVLIHQEAGGYSCTLEGDQYHVGLKEGHLLMAPDKETWELIAAKIKAALNPKQEGFLVGFTVTPEFK